MTSVAQSAKPALPVWRAFRFIVVLCGLAAAFVAVLAYEIHWLTTPTEGQTQGGALPVGSRKALVVLDVQEDYTGTTARAPFPYASAGELIARLNQLGARAAASDIDVIYVRQVFQRPLSKVVSHLLLGGTVLPGSIGAEFDRRLQRVTPHVFEKPRSDAFSSNAFETFVRSRDIGELILVGLDGAGCVDITARGARNRGLAVTILADAVVARDAADWRAKRQEYPTLGIRVLDSARFEFSARGTR